MLLFRVIHALGFVAALTSAQCMHCKGGCAGCDDSKCNSGSGRCSDHINLVSHFSNFERTRMFTGSDACGMYFNASVDKADVAAEIRENGGFVIPVRISS